MTASSIHIERHCGDPGNARRGVERSDLVRNIEAYQRWRIWSPEKPRALPGVGTLPMRALCHSARARDTVPDVAWICPTTASDAPESLRFRWTLGPARGLCLVALPSGKPARLPVDRNRSAGTGGRPPVPLQTTLPTCPASWCRNRWRRGAHGAGSTARPGFC